MPLHSFRPDSYNLPGYPEGQPNLPTSFDMNSNVLQLIDRVDCLEKLVRSLQQQLNSTEQSLTPRIANASAQTDDYNGSTMDFETLNEKIRCSQCDDRDISTLKYFLDHNIIPEASEISNFQPTMRRYLWHLPRFVVQDSIVYRKKMDSDRITETLQLVVPSSLVSKVLHTLHPSVGHVSLQSTLETISKHLFWPFVHRDITNFSSNCHLCHSSSASSDTSSSCKQSPSTIIQKAVCAITELTKDFIHCTESNEPHANHKKSMRPRKRSRKNSQPKPQSSSPPRSHLQPSRQEIHSRNSPRRKRQIQSSPLRYRKDSPPKEYSEYSPPQDYRQHSPPRDYCQQSPTREHRDQLPPRVTRSSRYSPPVDFYHDSSREYRNYSPPRDCNDYIPRDYLPFRDKRH